MQRAFKVRTSIQTLNGGGSGYHSFVPTVEPVRVDYHVDYSMLFFPPITITSSSFFEEVELSKKTKLP
jgi:hypothetical protein